MTLSGGMKRRVLIAKALSHEPTILFLDEPTAGVDVELRHDMWKMVRELRESGVTIILTTHYIEEAEEMADRIGVISKGELIVVEDKARADAQARQEAAHAAAAAPARRRCPTRSPICRSSSPPTGTTLTYTFDTQTQRDRHRDRCCAGSASTASTSRICTRARARSRTSSSAWSARMHEDAEHERATRRHQRPRDPRDLPLRDGAHVPHDHAEHRLAGAVDVALLRRVRRGDRLAHGRHRRRQLRRVHHSRA